MAGESEAKEPTGQTVDNRPCFFKYITAISRTWGILTSTALWYLAVRLIQHRDEYIYIQWYSLAVAILVTFFEFVWLITKSACCKDDGNCCCTLWRIVIWLDNWKKSVFYILISVPLFSKVSLGIVSGILVVVLAVFYLFKTCKYSDCVKRKKQQTSYVETECPQADLVSHEVQTSTSTYAPVDQSVTTVKETKATETVETTHSVTAQTSTEE